MFTLNEFIVLPFEEQCDFIAMGGDYLSKREVGSQKAYLYHLYGFFIEIWYCSEDDEIIKIDGFKNVENLVPYLKNINITDLLTKH